MMRLVHQDLNDGKNKGIYWLNHNDPLITEMPITSLGLGLDLDFDFAKLEAVLTDKKIIFSLMMQTYREQD